ncbi:MAG: PD-(D/E)XK nuclease-like domain-containing protein, partial [Campylobacter sp.]|nr:PD-(D/E)XK nuclease-like domain-containing protein [Campylobacter sp.]
MNLIKMNEREYHAHHALGSSDIKQLLVNPHGFRQEKPSSKALELGSLVHKLILEPQEFESSYYVLDNIDKRTKEGKERYLKALAEAEAENKEIIDIATYNQGKDIAEAFKNSAVSKLITDGVAEYCAFSEIDGVAVKCKPDYYRSDKKIII